MEPITISVQVATPKEKAWEYFTSPIHITQWNHASDDWECPESKNDLKSGGTFATTMRAKDLSVSFVFSGTYTEVKEFELIQCTLDDGRKTTTTFEEVDGVTTVTETFDPEGENPIDMQRDGWMAILNNFKIYTETN